MSEIALCKFSTDIAALQEYDEKILLGRIIQQDYGNNNNRLLNIEVQSDNLFKIDRFRFYTVNGSTPVIECYEDYKRKWIHTVSLVYKDSIVDGQNDLWVVYNNTQLIGRPDGFYRLDSAGLVANNYSVESVMAAINAQHPVPAPIPIPINNTQTRATNLYVPCLDGIVSLFYTNYGVTQSPYRYGVQRLFLCYLSDQGISVAKVSSRITRTDFVANPNVTIVLEETSPYLNPFVQVTPGNELFGSSMIVLKTKTTLILNKPPEAGGGTYTWSDGTTLKFFDFSGNITNSATDTLASSPVTENGDFIATTFNPTTRRLIDETLTNITPPWLSTFLDASSGNGIEAIRRPLIFTVNSLSVNSREMRNFETGEVLYSYPSTIAYVPAQPYCNTTWLGGIYAYLPTASPGNQTSRNLLVFEAAVRSKVVQLIPPWWIEFRDTRPFTQRISVLKVMPHQWRDDL